MSEAIVDARGLGKRFPRPGARPRLPFPGARAGRRLWLFRDVSFQLARGDSVALVGRNGCGKTTLLRLLTGIYRPDEGSLRVAADPRVLFRSSVGLADELTVRDNALLFGAVHGVPRARIRGRVDAILERAELTHLRDAPLKHLSMGQVRRLALEVFLEGDVGFLVLDEALDHLDEAHHGQVEARIRELVAGGTTLIMTSHRRDLLLRLCSRALWIDRGALAGDGDIRSVLAAYEGEGPEGVPGAGDGVRPSAEAPAPRSRRSNNRSSSSQR